MHKIAIIGYIAFRIALFACQRLATFVYISKIAKNIDETCRKLNAQYL